MHKKTHAFFILFSILIVTLINYLDRSAISFIILPLKTQFGINNQEFGFIASAFGIGYVCMCFFSGLIIDRFSAAKVWSIFAVAWSLSMIGLGCAQGFWSLFFFRFLLGLTEAANFPALLKVISHTLPVHWRAKAISMGLLGVPIASVIGSPLLSFIIAKLGWRAMFFILGSVGILWAILWRIFSARWITADKMIIGDKNESSKTTLKDLLTSRVMWGNGIQFFIFGYIVFFSLMWLPGFFEETYHQPILKTGFIVVLPWIMASIAVVCGAIFSDWLKSKSLSLWHSRALVIGLCLFFAGVCFFMIIFTTSLSLSITLIMIGLGFAFFPNALIFSLNADLFHHKAGTAQGIISSLFALSGVIAPALTGIIVEMTHSFYGVFIQMGALSLLSLFVVFFIQKKTLLNQ